MKYRLGLFFFWLSRLFYKLSARFEYVANNCFEWSIPDRPVALTVDHFRDFRKGLPYGTTQANRDEYFLSGHRVIYTNEETYESLPDRWTK